MNTASITKMYERELLGGGQADPEDLEPMHVYLTADSDENLEVGAAMITAIINQTEEAKKFAIVTYDSSI